MVPFRFTDAPIGSIRQKRELSLVARRDRIKRSARSEAFKDPRPLIVAVCEGKVTEIEYFVGFRNYARNPRVRFETERAVGDPKKVVERARELKTNSEARASKWADENIRLDQVWAVFDRDDHTRFDEALQMARDNEINLAVSNPNFELWLLLHFQEQPGLRDRVDVVRLLKRWDSNFDKHVDFKKYESGYKSAETRAEQLDNGLLANPPYANPSTGIWRLTRHILQEC